MPTVVPVKFSYASRELWFDPQQSAASEADHVICQTARGQEIGLVTQAPRDLSEAELQHTIGDSQLMPVLRIATGEDLARADRLARTGEQDLEVFKSYVTDSGLDMKPVGVEYLFDGEKAVCYFVADERVDFRQLVRDLAHAFHVRIDMRQIGVREEAALVGGYGHCGQELCCVRFKSSFDPVSIRMAKEQDLPLNSTKISGACGRLMCCLRYEFEAYKDFKSRAPKRSSIIQTPLGTAKVIEYNTPKELITLRLEGGRSVQIALADMSTSKAACDHAEKHTCGCRPDSVSRSVLEKLQSPEIQMALEELDRQFGIVRDEAGTADVVGAVDVLGTPETPGAPSAPGDPFAETPAAAERSNRHDRSDRAAYSDRHDRAASKRRSDTSRSFERSLDNENALREHTRSARQQKASAATETRRRRRPGDRGGALQDPYSADAAIERRVQRTTRKVSGRVEKRSDRHSDRRFDKRPERHSEKRADKRLDKRADSRASNQSQGAQGAQGAQDRGSKTTPRAPRRRHHGGFQTSKGNDS